MGPDGEPLAVLTAQHSVTGTFVPVHLASNVLKFECAVPRPRRLSLLVCNSTLAPTWSCPYLQVRTFDEHEESVYSLAWSASDAWVLASLSYDGLVVLNHVPSTEKYKILL